MKILWLTKKYFDIDVDTATWIEVTKELQKKGHKIYLLGFYKKQMKNFDINNMTLIKVMFKNIRFLSFLYNMIRIIFYSYYRIIFNKIDVIILSSFQLVLLFIPIKSLSYMKIIRIKLILDVRTYPNETGSKREELLDIIFGFILKYSYLLVDGITAITAAMKEQICEKYGIPAINVGIWTSGVNHILFSSKNIHNLPNEYNYLKDKFVLFYHGALSEKRAIKNAIMAIKLLDMDVLQITVMLIFSFGKLKDDYKKLVEENHIDKYVIIKDAVPYEEMPMYIAIADVGIMPYCDVDYWNTSSPIKLLEYLSMKKPIILSDIRSHRDVIGNKSCGIYLKNNSPSSIAKTIKQLYKKKDDLKKDGEVGRNIIMRQFTWEKCANDLLAFLQECAIK